LVIEVELRHLRYFLAVADELHFGRAAASLQIVQPALSQQIKKLEQAVGATLLARTSRSVVLTPAGEALRDRARALLTQARRDLDEVARIGRGEQGRLDVGFVSSAVGVGPIQSIRRFRDLYPGVEVQLHEGFTSQLIARLGRSEIDVATVRDPDGHPGIRATALLSEPFVAILPVGHPGARHTGIGGAELAEEPFVLYPRSAGETAYRRNLEAVTETGRQPRIAQEASNWNTIMHLVGAGLGVTIAPRSAATAAPATVAVCPLNGTAARSTLYLIARKDDTRPIIARFAEIASGGATHGIGTPARAS
jgi:DNA-binding transcriptional LysR family regulator